MSNELINRIGLPLAWAGGLIGMIPQEDITLYLTWSAQVAAIFASIVIGWVNLRKRK